MAAMKADARERARADIHDLLPDGWHVGRGLPHPHTRRWTITARSSMRIARR